MNHGFGGAELRAGGPAAVLYAKNVKGQGVGVGRDDAVLGNDAVLLATADEFTGEENDGTLTAIDEHELVH